jgi:hypothetical protein
MRYVSVVVFLVFIYGCAENEAMRSDLTGNQITYALQAGSVYPVNGTVTFQEKKDQTTLVVIEVTGTEGSLTHPVHLHLGNTSAPAAEVSALLTPVAGNTGKSVTLLTALADESLITYSELTLLNACIKIHLGASGPDRDIILAAGNIGSASGSPNGRADISVCKSE